MMDRKVYICLLILCGIFLQETSASSEENSNSEGLHIRKKRVIGGRPAVLQDAPYVVNIFANRVNDCTGSLLLSNLAITAAHCFHFPPGTHFNILSGSPMSGAGIAHNITKIIPYPAAISSDHNNDHHDHDIALFKFFPPIKFENSLNKPIKLYNGLLPSNSVGTIFSWGCFEIKGTEKIFPKQLQSAALPIISLHECQNIYARNGGFVITVKHVCTASANGRRRCEDGDSGAPLVVHGHLVGVMSWSTNYSIPLPDIFISMLHADFRSWIFQYIPSPSSS